MESFIYSDLNKACRNKETHKIQYYGAFAAALSFIIDNANRKINKSLSTKKKNVLYRGIKLSHLEADAYEVGRTVHLTGYTSTSRQFNVALEFAMTELTDYTTPVVI